jgi:hypothetical protein
MALLASWLVHWLLRRVVSLAPDTWLLVGTAVLQKCSKHLSPWSMRDVRIRFLRVPALLTSAFVCVAVLVLACIPRGSYALQTRGCLQLCGGSASGSALGVLSSIALFARMLAHWMLHRVMSLASDILLFLRNAAFRCSEHFLNCGIRVIRTRVGKASALLALPIMSVAVFVLMCSLHPFHVNAMATHFRVSKTPVLLALSLTSTAVFVLVCTRRACSLDIRGWLQHCGVFSVTGLSWLALLAGSHWELHAIVSLASDFWPSLLNVVAQGYREHVLTWSARVILPVL